MNSASSKSVLRKIGILYILFTLLVSSLPTGAFADTLSVDLKANGQDSLTLTSTSTPFTITVASTGATACQQTSPVISGISTSASMDIPFGHPYYPAVGGSTTFTVTCTDGVTNASDSVVVALNVGGDSGNPGNPGGGTAGTPTVDIKANGSDGPLTLNATDSYTYTWASTNTTACQQTSPETSGISTSGTSASVAAGHPYFPTAGHPVTITITCTNGVTNASDSVVIGLNESTGGGATTTPTVDVKANGSDGPLSISANDTYTFTWASTNATACQQSSPVTSGISTAGVSSPIASGHPFFPTAGHPVTITITCTNGVTNASDSVVIGLATGGGTGTTTPTVDVKANGSDGPVNLVNGAPYTFTWTSTNATACQQTSPVISGISTEGTSSSIAPGHPFYPAVGGSVTITVTCTNGVTNATDSVVITASTNGGGGGCQAPVITSAATASANFGQPFSFTFTASSVNGSTTFAVDPSVLPPGLSFSTSTATISGSLTQTGSFTVPFSVTDICGTTSGTLIIATPNTGGGGGGGGGGGSTPILGTGGHHEPTPVGTSCILLHDYMRMDFQNDPNEVVKLQTFLRTIMGYSNVSITGTFDQATFDAVSAFQVQYRDEILTPWGLPGPTGYVYMLTLRKINDIWCHVLNPLTPAQQQEISDYHTLIARYGTGGTYYGSTGGYVRHTVTETTQVPVLEEGSTTSTIIPIVGVSTTTIYKGHNSTSTAASIFAFPNTGLGFFQCLYELLLILVVLYILGSILKDVLYADVPENVLKRFMTKWITIILGLIVAIIIAWLMSEWCLILPLVIALIIAILWLIFARPKMVAPMALRETTVITSKPGEINTVENKDGSKTVIVAGPATSAPRE